MKSRFFIRSVFAPALVTAFSSNSRAEVPAPFIYESPEEFFGTGDFDGDGRTDLVIVDKESGKYRLGYQLTDGVISWVDCRPTGEKLVAGFTVGKLFDPKRDAIAVTSPEANHFVMAEASNPTATARPQQIPFTAALGPNTIVAIDIGGEGNTPKPDFYLGSIYNSPDANQVALLRNDGSTFPTIGEAPLAGPATRANHLALKSGGPEALAEIIATDKGDTFLAQDFRSGKPVDLATVTGLPAGSQYAAGHFRKAPLLDFLFYKPGDSKLTLRPIEEKGNAFQFGAPKSFDLSEPVLRVIPLRQGQQEQLFVIFGAGEKGGVFNFDGQAAPALVQTIVSTNELLTGAGSFEGGMLVFSHPAAVKFSQRYLAYHAASAAGAAYEFSAFGSLPSLADNDNMTIPEIHDRIVANIKEKTADQMKAYTNTIPGTPIKYAMVPIPPGEFVMGSPESEPLHKPDEGPQHKVKISPFWMQQFEITWSEYELFMYQDEEHRLRTTNPTDETGDKLADGVTHPSKPYVEMSFGMGKEGFPAIAMTQHAANKYCQWLSAKTGHFYRLPTEAEWEYACRAGTTTTYFWGEDGSKLGEYAWYEQNSNFKYQKVGRKKPNPWGLYDIYGNVVEWVLDQYDPDYYKKTGNAVDPWNKAAKPYPHVVRGGSWDDEAALCRSAARRGSDRSWKMQDPQLPKSIFYFTDATFVGFRIVRPLKVPTAEEMQKYWTSGVERD
jgi:formylglycine-generating enzyme required for sulfatase activity